MAINTLTSDPAYVRAISNNVYSSLGELRKACIEDRSAFERSINAAMSEMNSLYSGRRDETAEGALIVMSIGYAELLRLMVEWEEGGEIPKQ